MSNLRNVFKKVIISGEQGSGKTLLACDMGFKRLECKDVSSNYTPENDDTCLIYASSEPVEIEGFLCIHLKRA